jgi:hypothetical protein
MRYSYKWDLCLKKFCSKNVHGMVLYGLSITRAIKNKYHLCFYKRKDD